MVLALHRPARAHGAEVSDRRREGAYVEAVREIPKEEVQFIHDADTEAKKAELFGKVRSGAVRVLMGSTQKMGAGTNVQTRLCALHHLDCPWRPAILPSATDVWYVRAI